MTDLKVTVQLKKTPKHNGAFAECHDDYANGNSHFLVHVTCKIKKRNELSINYDCDHSLIIPVQLSSPKYNILDKENSSIHILSTTAMMNLLRSTSHHVFPKIMKDVKKVAELINLLKSLIRMASKRQKFIVICVLIMLLPLVTYLTNTEMNIISLSVMKMEIKKLSINRALV